jgi:tRNA(fMet)-specific endonuclease VapC
MSGQLPFVHSQGHGRTFQLQTKSVRGKRLTFNGNGFRVFALDTNTVIYFFKGVGRVHDRLITVPPSEVALPSVVLFELEVGIGLSTHASKRRSQLDMLLSVVTILPLELRSARFAADLNRELSKAGHPIGPMDTLIAGISMAHNATLVTHNTKEFNRVRGLRLDDWF